MKKDASSGDYAALVAVRIFDKKIKTKTFHHITPPLVKKSSVLNTTKELRLLFILNRAKKNI